MRVYVIFDRVAQESGPLFEAKNDAVAVRQARNLIASANGARPDEFRLLYMGDIDHDTNMLSLASPPVDVEYIHDTVSNVEEAQ